MRVTNNDLIEKMDKLAKLIGKPLRIMSEAEGFRLYEAEDVQLVGPYRRKESQHGSYYRRLKE